LYYPLGSLIFFIRNSLGIFGFTLLILSGHSGISIRSIVSYLFELSLYILSHSIGSRTVEIADFCDKIIHFINISIASSGDTRAFFTSSIGILIGFLGVADRGLICLNTTVEAPIFGENSTV
jgi:hypothetical protein